MRAPLLTAAALAAALLTGGCTEVPAVPSPPAIPSGENERDDLLKIAQQSLVDRCLTARGLRPPSQGTTSKPTAEDRKARDALFGTGARELSVTLATGYTVTAHSDGCLAEAQRTLYGDQRRWFRAQVTVNNIDAEAAARMAKVPEYQAARARWERCVGPAGDDKPPAPAVQARCDRESGLGRTRARLEPNLLAEVRELRRTELAAYGELRDRALRRAVVTLASARPENDPG
ncbi:hypothetical protein ACFQ2B_16445 [Streptomyces stramineus]|uniref:Lipoprotein n=1 Tax=Streptomyces stramineus TaxID=173861 RepID=A0ABP3L3M8_9ACTN